MSTAITPRLTAYFPKDFAFDRFYLGKDVYHFAYTVTNDTLVRGRGSFISLHEGAKEGRVVAAIHWQQTGKLVISDLLRTPGQMTRPCISLHTSHKTKGYYFRMNVGLPGQPPQQRSETFEWRATGGNEVRGLHPRAFGWKLVRLGRGVGKGGNRKTRQVGETSDGKEVVAVWGTVPGPWRSWFLPTKSAFMFELCGSGKTGELGEKFHIFALMTALQIYGTTEQFVWGWKCIGMEAY